MTAPKPGDVLTAEQALALPDGAVVDIIERRTVSRGWVGSSQVTPGSLHAYVNSPVVDLTATLVSLPTPPDMAPGSVVLDEDGVAWARGSTGWYDTRPFSNPLVPWSAIASRVARVLHDAAVTP